jgi:hypothetical protein
MSTRGGETIEIFRNDFEGLINAVWTPDSRAVLTRRADQLWKFPIAGGEPVKLGFNLPSGLNIHPNGRQIAYVVAEPAKPAEVWVLENILAGQK